VLKKGSLQELVVAERGQRRKWSLWKCC